MTLGIPGHTVPAECRSLVREFGDRRHHPLRAQRGEPEQVAELAFECRILVRWTRRSWVAVDQEGGRVARLRAPLTVWPPAAAVGRSGDEALAGGVSPRPWRENCVRSGFTFDCAPVLDVLTNADNPAIGDRAIAG